MVTYVRWVPGIIPGIWQYTTAVYTAAVMYAYTTWYSSYGAKCYVCSTVMCIYAT